MPGDVGERLLDDPVGGPAPPRPGTSWRSPFDRQRRVQAGRCGRVRTRSATWSRPRGGAVVVVVAQRLQGRAQLPGRLAAGLLDRQQRRGTCSPRLRATWTATSACTLMIEIWWVSESCSSRAMRSRSSSARRRAVSSRVRSASSARRSACRSASPAAPAAISQASLERAPGLGERLAGVVEAGGEGGQREEGQHGRARPHGDHPVSGADGGVHREQERDGGDVVTGRLVAHRAQAGDGQDGDRRAAAGGQRPGRRSPAGRGRPGRGGVPARPPDRPVTSSVAATPTAITQSVTTARPALMSAPQPDVTRGRLLRGDDRPGYRGRGVFRGSRRVGGSSKCPRPHDDRERVRRR